MTTEYDDENCGQLIIATDDELVDCPPASPDGESEFSSTTEPSQKLDVEKSNVKVSGFCLLNSRVFLLIISDKKLSKKDFGNCSV